MTNFNSVKKFMEVFGQEVKTKAEFPSEKIIKLRYNLIKEELEELKDAIHKKDLVEVPKTVLDSIEIIAVKNVDEVLKVALTKPLKRVEWVEVDQLSSKEKNEELSTH